MLAQKIVSIHPMIILIFWIALALASPGLMVFGGQSPMFVVNALSLVGGACWCGWMWAIRMAALQETPEDVTPRRAWLHLLPLLAFLLVFILPDRAQEMGGLPAIAANLAAILIFGSTAFCLWKTAEALERMVARGEVPSKWEVFNTMVLVGMIYVAPFVVARRFATRAKLDQPSAA